MFVGPHDSAPPTVIIGGLGAVGRMLHRELSEELGPIVDVDLRCGRNAGRCAVRDSPERELVAGARTVVLAVHESVALSLLPPLAAVLSDDALLVETLSVKGRFSHALKCEPPRCEILGINPMFAPSLDMEGRAVAVVPHRSGTRADGFVSRLAALGAQVTELSAEAHDRAVAALQALPHVTILAFAQAFAACDLDLESALRLAPPPASALLALAARIANGNPVVYQEVQNANPFAAAARDSLAKSLDRLLCSGLAPCEFESVLDEIEDELADCFPVLLGAAERLAVGQLPPSAGPRGHASSFLNGTSPARLAADRNSPSLSDSPHRVTLR